MIRESLLLDFKKEVNQNRSALLRKDFKSCWGFLGLNPDLLQNINIDSCSSWYLDVFQYDFLENIIRSTKENEIYLHLVSDLNDGDLLYSLENIALNNGQNWNTSNPYVSSKLELLEESFRLTLIHPTITSSNRPRAFLRRLKSKPIDLSEYSPSDVLKEIISLKKNIIISGSTGSGKTTLAQSLLSQCSVNEHLVILEDTHELYLNGMNTTHLLSNEDFSLIDYCSYALRISPDRLILGELRGEEILPLVLAMNTGHKGFMTTIHANDAPSALTRLKTLLEFYAPKNSSCFSMICQNIDLIIHMENKVITQIIEVKGLDGEVPLFDYLFKSETEPVHESL